MAIYKFSTEECQFSEFLEAYNRGEEFTLEVLDIRIAINHPPKHFDNQKIYIEERKNGSVIGYAGDKLIPIRKYKLSNGKTIEEMWEQVIVNSYE